MCLENSRLILHPGSGNQLCSTFLCNQRYQFHNVCVKTKTLRQKEQPSEGWQIYQLSVGADLCFLPYGKYFLRNKYKNKTFTMQQIVIAKSCL